MSKYTKKKKTKNGEKRQYMHQKSSMHNRGGRVGCPLFIHRTHDDPNTSSKKDAALCTLRSTVGQVNLRTLDVWTPSGQELTLKTPPQVLVSSRTLICARSGRVAASYTHTLYIHWKLRVLPVSGAEIEFPLQPGAPC